MADGFLWSAELFAEYRRLLRKVNGIKGPGVVNTPDGILINPPPQMAAKKSPTDSRILAFPVHVVSDGGSAGTSSTTCTFTYTVKSLDDVTLVKDATGNATAMSPVWARPSLGKMVAATKGMAYRDSSGTLVLFQVDEVEATVARAC